MANNTGNQLRRLLLGGLVTAVLVAVSIPARGEPYIAIRTGFKCSQCHVNQTGGGMRTEFGVIYSQFNLPLKVINPSGTPQFLSGRVSELLSVGANFRAENTTTFEYQDPQGVVAPNRNQSRIPEANIYFKLDLIPDALILYTDQTLTPNATNREFFGLWRDSDAEYYVKVGRMLLPYGLRLLDDEAFIRNRTGFTYNRSDLGAEFGLEPGPLSVVTNVTDSQLSLVGSSVFRRFRIGGSFARSTLREDQHVWGAFAGTSFGRITLMGEGDFITENEVDRFAALAEIDILLQRGFNFKATYEFFDRNRDVSNDRDGQERISFGVEPFITQFLQVGVFYRINRFIPQAAAENQDSLTVQLHAFF